MKEKNKKERVLRSKKKRRTEKRNKEDKRRIQP
jgi:hypothetical protein